MNPQNPQQQPTPGTPQQQVIERLRTAVNVLVTVSNNPTVDQLAAAIGFTLTLNKMGKHATAVFSGQAPSTIEFLKPEATIEKNTDSLRDFIVSLDKSKADKLRYKVEENVVKIFITPYRTSLSEKDLMFSQGDFNVDAVVALGVSEREQLDQAIVAHGRILHDATVITVSAGQTLSSLGAINWQDTSASSLCEMLVSVADALQPGLLDNQIATAYLTGIVAQTERFRNDKTTPKIMTMAATLMAAGANQQLIAAQLEHAVEASLKPSAVPMADAAATASPDGALTIEHTDVAPDEQKAETPEGAGQIAIDEHGNLSSAEEAQKAAETPEPTPLVQPDKHRRQLLEEPPAEPKAEPTEAERFAGGPHPFTADMSDDGQDEPSSDPLTGAIPAAETGKLLTHGKDIHAEELKKPETETKPADEPGNILPPVVDTPAPATVTPPADDDIPAEETVPPALDNNTLRDIEKTFDSMHIAKDPSSTLNEIEEVVDSPHLNPAAAPTADVNTARSAVDNAIEANYDPTRPTPLQALNAAPLGMPSAPSTPAADPVLAGLGLTDQVAPSAPSVLPPAPQVVAPTSAPAVPVPSGPTPPPVPPPMMPLK